MKIAIITGSTGLIGSESARFFSKQGFTIVGIDNNLRQYFFGNEGSTDWNKIRLEEDLGDSYIHKSIDIRDDEEISKIFNEYGSDIRIIIHCASQPSHDWSAKEPITDFTINANGTLNLLEKTRKYCKDSPFIFCSTNKVYGDTPNRLPMVEHQLRWEIKDNHAYYNGIDEAMSIDKSTHSIFGASKVAADIMVQEYGRYFDMYTVCFRGGCLTGPSHSGAELHGFLSYLMKCCMTGNHYNIYGYKGKQVRDNIHSSDFVNAFYHYFLNPRKGEIYNIGGTRFSNCSILEAIEMSQKITDKRLDFSFLEQNRIGDHIWWISNADKFKAHYPKWDLIYDVDKILNEIYEQNISRW